MGPRVQLTVAVALGVHPPPHPPKGQQTLQSSRVPRYLGSPSRAVYCMYSCTDRHSRRLPAYGFRFIHTVHLCRRQSIKNGKGSELINFQLHLASLPVLPNTILFFSHHHATFAFLSASRPLHPQLFDPVASSPARFARLPPFPDWPRIVIPLSPHPEWTPS